LVKEKAPSSPKGEEGRGWVFTEEEKGKRKGAFIILGYGSSGKDKRRPNRRKGERGEEKLYVKKKRTPSGEKAPSRLKRKKGFGFCHRGGGGEKGVHAEEGKEGGGGPFCS